MKLKSEFIIHKSGDEQLMISVGGNFNGMVRSNSTAGRIIDMLAEETTEEMIVEKLLLVYDVERERLASDVARVIAELRKIGAIDD